MDKPTATSLPRTHSTDHPHDTGALARRPAEGDAPLSAADREKALWGVRHILELACRPDREPRASLGYFLSPGTSSWEGLLEAEALLAGELHATVQRRRYVQWSTGVAEDQRISDQKVIEAWAAYARGLRADILIPTTAGFIPARVVEALGAWAIVEYGELDDKKQGYSLTWGPMGMAATTGTLEEMRGHLAALAELSDHSAPGHLAALGKLGGHSDPSWAGAPGIAAERLIRSRLTAARTVTP